MGNAASILQSLVQSPEDRLFGYLQSIRHVMDDSTVEKPTPSVSGALLEACFVSMRSLKQLFESKLTFSKRKYVLILHRHNIRDLITLNGDKAMNFFQAARRRNKRNDDVDDHVKIPTRLERLCRELPKIREELKQTGRFSFEMENFNGAMSGISPAKV
eukprot:g6528.t1